MNARTPNGIPSWGFDHEQPDHGGLERWEEGGSEPDSPVDAIVERYSEAFGAIRLEAARAAIEETVRELRERVPEDYAPTSQPDPAWREYVDGLELLRWSDDADEIGPAVSEAGSGANEITSLRFKIESTTALTFDAAWREAEVLKSVGRSGEGRDVAEDLRLLVRTADGPIGADLDVSCDGHRVDDCFLADEVNGVVLMSTGTLKTGFSTARLEGHVEIHGLTDDERREYRKKYAELYR